PPATHPPGDHHTAARAAPHPHPATQPDTPPPPPPPPAKGLPTPASPPRRKPLADLAEQREVPLGAVEPVTERALAVELAVRDLEPHRARRVHGQVGRGRDPLEAPAPAARDVEIVVARLAAAHAELDAGPRVARGLA